MTSAQEQELREAVECAQLGESSSLNSIVEWLRYVDRMTYKEIYEAAVSVGFNGDKADWDAFLREIEDETT